MTLKAYIAWMSSVFTTAMFYPGFTELLTVLVIAVVVLVTVIVNILLRLKILTDQIVEALIQGFLNDPDVRKIVEQRINRVQLKNRIKAIIEEKRKAEAKTSDAKK